MPTTLDLTAPPTLPRGIDLPYSDGEPLESLWHVYAMNLLLACIEHHWRDRSDFFAGGNQFFYFDPAQARNVNFRGPDFYVVKGATHELRRSWVAWEEGWRVPNVIVELVSESTADVDRVTKKAVYLEQLDVKEYYCYDPDGPLIQGWRKGKRKPTTIKQQGGRLWSEELELFLGSWDGEYHRQRAIWPRFFDAAGNLIPRADEASERRAEAEAARAGVEAVRAEAEAARAEAEAARAEVEAARAEVEAARAEAERKAKDAALAELAKLRAELAVLKNTPTA